MKSDALKELETLHRKTIRRLFPNVPARLPAPNKFSDKTTVQLIGCILKWLELNNCWAIRINTTGRYLQGQLFSDVWGHKKQSPGKWIPVTTRRRTADIHAVIASRRVSVEVTIGRDRISNAQHKTREAIERSGGIYWIVGSFDDFLQNYRAMTGDR
jgi:hypothetical protein